MCRRSWCFAYGKEDFMELKEALLRRRSIRKFTAESVSQDSIEAMLRAAMSSPSACNKRPWDFYVVTEARALDRLRSATHFAKYHAPLAIVVCGSLSRALPGSMAAYWIQDCSAATQSLLLRATDLGLGAVWCGVHPQPRAEALVCEALSLEEGMVPLNIIWIGHPAEDAEPRDQYEQERVHYIR